MKKILLSLLSVIFLSGCSPVKVEPLKTSKDRIIGSKIVENYVRDDQFLGAATTSIKTPVPLKKIEYVKYRYLSNKPTKRKPYFNGSNGTNAEYLPARADGKEPVAFYAEVTFVRDQGTVYDVEEATTTVENFKLLTKPTLVEIAKEFLTGQPAIAQTSFTASTTYTPPGAGFIQYLVVGAGGGTGNTNASAGAGGGGVASGTTSTDGTAITIIVGTGGSGYIRGSTTTFNGFSVGGGAAGADETNRTGMVGANGGGGIYDGTGGASNDGGYSGGNGGGSGNNYPSGGGAGDGGNGVTPANNLANGGNGGPGTASSITGSQVYYGAGGGAGAWTGTSARSSAGTGGSCQGGRNSAGDEAATEVGANKGEGACGNGVAGYGNHKGGDGVVIVVFTASGGSTTTCTNQGYICEN